jgi:hypothetical protein
LALGDTPPKPPKTKEPELYKAYITRKKALITHNFTKFEPFKL